MSIVQMRNAILKVYRGEKWILKVADMSDKQVYAVYMSFLKRGLIR
jgi:hypothetical protein